MARLYRGRKLITRQFESKSKQRGYVYFMRSVGNGLIKIGWSASHPDVRLKRIRATSPTPIAPLAFMEGGLERESALHDRFAGQWSHGEWFGPSPELLALIESDGKPWPDPVIKRRLLKPKGARPELAASSEESQLVKWAKKITGGCCGDPRVLPLYEWSELYGIPLEAMWQWKIDGFNWDLIGHYVKMRGDERGAIVAP